MQQRNGGGARAIAAWVLGAWIVAGALLWAWQKLAPGVPEGMRFVCYRAGQVEHELPARRLTQRINPVTGGEHWVVELVDGREWRHYADPEQVCGPQWPRANVD